MATDKKTGNKGEEKGKKQVAEPMNNKGMAAGILHEVGKMLGIENVLEKAGENKLIRDRLDRIDSEIERRLAESPLGGEGATPRTPMPSPRRRGAPHLAKKQAEPDAEIFDEGEYIMVLLPLPGVEASTIEAVMSGERLIISFTKSGRCNFREFILPLIPEGGITKAYRNGILEVRVGKKKV